MPVDADVRCDADIRVTETEHTTQSQGPLPAVRNSLLLQEQLQRGGASGHDARGNDRDLQQVKSSVRRVEEQVELLTNKFDRLLKEMRAAQLTTENEFLQAELDSAVRLNTALSAAQARGPGALS